MESVAIFFKQKILELHFLNCFWMMARHFCPFTTTVANRLTKIVILKRNRRKKNNWDNAECLFRWNLNDYQLEKKNVAKNTRADTVRNTILKSCKTKRNSEKVKCCSCEEFSKTPQQQMLAEVDITEHFYKPVNTQQTSIHV